MATAHSVHAHTKCPPRAICLLNLGVGLLIQVDWVDLWYGSFVPLIGGNPLLRQLDCLVGLTRAEPKIVGIICTSGQVETSRRVASSFASPGELDLKSNWEIEGSDSCEYITPTTKRSDWSASHEGWIGASFSHLRKPIRICLKNAWGSNSPGGGAQNQCCSSVPRYRFFRTKWNHIHIKSWAELSWAVPSLPSRVMLTWITQDSYGDHPHPYHHPFPHRDGWIRFLWPVSECCLQDFVPRMHANPYTTWAELTEPSMNRFRGQNGTVKRVNYCLFKTNSVN